jgi:hypothetical protein
MDLITIYGDGVSIRIDEHAVLGRPLAVDLDRPGCDQSIGGAARRPTGPGQKSVQAF